MENQHNGNQADKLMELFKEISDHSPENELLTESDERTVKDFKDQDFIELDVLKLPPRKEVHQSARQKFSFSTTNPMTRFGFVIFLLITVLLIIYFSFGKRIIVFFN